MVDKDHYDLVSCKIECDGSPKIKWTSLNELKKGTFLIEGSMDTYSWTKVSKRKGKGHSPFKKNYKTSLLGRYKCYRISQMNEEGENYKYRIIRFQCFDKAEVKIYPLAESKSLLVKSGDYKKVGFIHLKLKNENGQTIWETGFKPYAPETFVKLGASIAPGTYTITTNIDNVESITIQI